MSTGVLNRIMKDIFNILGARILQAFQDTEQDIDKLLDDGGGPLP